MAVSKAKPYVVAEMRRLSRAIKDEMFKRDEAFWRNAYVRQVQSDQDRSIILEFKNESNVLSLMRQLKDDINLRLGTSVQCHEQYDMWINSCLTIPVMEYRFITELVRVIDKLLDDMTKLP